MTDQSAESARPRGCLCWDGSGFQLACWDDLCHGGGTTLCGLEHFDFDPTWGEDLESDHDDDWDDDRGAHDDCSRAPSESDIS